MNKNGKHFYNFGPFSLNTTKRRLLRDGEPVPLGDKALQALLTLIENRDRVVTSEELLKAVWPTTSVEDNNLPQQIGKIRRTIGDDVREPADQYVRTIRGQGYRFMADVAEEWESETVPEIQILEPPETLPQPVPERRSKGSRWWIRILAFAAIVAIALLLPKWLFPRRPDVLPSTEPVRIGRVLVRSTSQGRSLQRISLSHPSEFLAISPNGKKVYATNRNGRVLSIVSAADSKVRELPLPRDAGPMAISPDGKLYIGSRVEGLMVLDTTKDQLLPGMIPTGGSVWDMAISPDGEKLFLAMDKAGLKRLSIKESKLNQISNRICPLFLKVDRQGRNLYVTYQCSGPGGKPGHDSMEIFDVATEALVATVTGPPMVGGDLAVSPDGRLVLIDGWNACMLGDYDRAGCPPVPGRIFHFFRPADRRILTTLTFPDASGKALFLDDSRFLLTGESLSVVDAAKYTTLETLDLNSTKSLKAVVAPNLSRIYVGYIYENALLILEPEKAECSPPSEGLTILYAGDGTLNDSAGICPLDRHEGVTFAPGKVGQAFSFDGDGSFLTASWTGEYEFGNQDATIALYVKFAGIQGERALVNRMTEHGDAGWRLLKSADDHIEFHKDGSTVAPNVVKSETAVHENAWYHVVITKIGQRVAIYVNAHFQGTSEFAGTWQSARDNPLYLGSTPNHRATLRGLLDEVAFYNRALTPKEIQALYNQREGGPCKL